MSKLLVIFFIFGLLGAVMNQDDDNSIGRHPNDDNDDCIRHCKPKDGDDQCCDGYSCYVLNKYNGYCFRTDRVDNDCLRGCVIDENDNDDCCEGTTCLDSLVPAPICVMDAVYRGLAEFATDLAIGSINL